MEIYKNKILFEHVMSCSKAEKVVKINLVKQQNILPKAEQHDQFSTEFLPKKKLLLVIKSKKKDEQKLRNNRHRSSEIGVYTLFWWRCRKLDVASQKIV